MSRFDGKAYTPEQSSSQQQKRRTTKKEKQLVKTFVNQRIIEQKPDGSFWWPGGSPPPCWGGKGHNVNEFCDANKLSKKKKPIYDIISGKTQKPKGFMQRIIEEALGMPDYYLSEEALLGSIIIDHKSETLIEEVKNIRARELLAEQQRAPVLPYITPRRVSHVANGRLVFTERLAPLAFSSLWLASVTPNPDDSFMVKLSGPSPSILGSNAATWILVVPLNEKDPMEGVFAIIGNDKVKLLTLSQQGQDVLVKTEDGCDLPVNISSIKLLGKVVASGGPLV